jgi:hypothetical protein
MLATTAALEATSATSGPKLPAVRRRPTHGRKGRDSAGRLLEPR